MLTGFNCEVMPVMTQKVFPVRGKRKQWTRKMAFSNAATSNSTNINNNASLKVTPTQENWKRPLLNKA